MRILIVQESDWIKRNNHQQHHLAELMSLRGHEIRVIDYEIMWRQGKKELKSERQVFENVHKIYDGARVTVIRPSIIKFPILDYVSLYITHKKEIEKQLREFKPDVVIGFSILNSYCAMKLCRTYGIPFVYYWLDVLHELIPIKQLRFLGRWIEEEIFDNNIRTIALNKLMKEYMVKLGASTNTEVITAGVNHELFNRSVKGIRASFGFNKGDVVLLFMGWLYKFSGLKEVIIEMARVKNKRIKLLVVGSGDEQRYLVDLVYQNDLYYRVKICGQQPYDEIPSLLASADICILPSYTDAKEMQHNVPIKIYEYLAMGKPIISTKLSGVMAEFPEGNGIFYVDNPQDVVSKALEIGHKPIKVCEVPSWDEIADKFEELLNEFCKL